MLYTLVPVLVLAFAVLLQAPVVLLCRSIWLSGYILTVALAVQVQATGGIPLMGVPCFSDF